MLHIGLPKTRTTYFQALLRYYCNKTNIPYFYNNQKEYEEVRKYVFTRNFFCKKCHDPIISNKTYVSYEELVGWYPNHYLRNCKKNQKAFGRSRHILLTIRKPSDFFRSLYDQIGVKTGVYIDSKHFFVNVKSFSQNFSLINSKFNLNDFNYSKLIDMYKNNFDTVTIVKSEYLMDKNIIKKIFINSQYLMDLSKFNTNISLNRSFNKNALKITKCIYFILKFLVNLILSSNILSKSVKKIFIRKLKNEVKKDLKNKYILRYLSKNDLNKNEFCDLIIKGVYLKLGLQKYFINNFKMNDKNKVKHYLPFEKTVKKLDQDYKKIPIITTFSNGKKTNTIPFI